MYMKSKNLQYSLQQETIRTYLKFSTFINNRYLFKLTIKDLRTKVEQKCKNN